MALFGNIEHLAQILGSDPRFQQAFAYLKRCQTPGSTEDRRLRGMAIDVVEKDYLEQGSIAMDQVYMTRQRRDCFFESHRKYIDVQYIFEGEEVMDVTPIRDLKIEHAYHDEKDVTKYFDAGVGSRLRLHAGQAAIFFPVDGHMPGQFAESSALVRKTVIKVPVRL